MARPILFAVDDDVSVLEAVVGDLRRKYAQDYRVVRAASGQAALDTCTQLKERGDSVALFLSDQRMPGMTGVDFLSRAIELYPEAKRVLLTAYADTEAAIRAINTAKIHYYLNKPWDPPEDKLYPVLDDLLFSWTQGYKPPFEGLQVVGTRWGSQDHAVRDFLNRNHVNFRWLNPEAQPEAIELLKSRGLDDSKLPVVMFSDGTAAVQPAQTALAEKIGLRVQAEKDFYDVVVIGAGPAGLAAGVYGASEGLRTLVVEPDAVGGQAGSSSRIENYLGFPDGVSGDELARRGFIQAQRLGAEFVTQRVKSLRVEDQYRIVTMEDGREVSCAVVLVATGVSWCKLDVPGGDSLVGAGVYYGAAQSEAAACKDEEVFVVGGANSAGQAAMNFAKYARKVTMLVRGKGLEQSMSKYLIDQIAATPNITVETLTEITRFCGGDHLQGIEVRTPNGTEERAASSVFIFIGAAPKTQWLPNEICRDERGFILAGPDLKRVGLERFGDRDPYLLETSVPGVFVAGDVRHGSVKRAASAVGEGSIAIQFVHQYLRGFNSMAAFAECLVTVEWQRAALEELNALQVFGDVPSEELACFVAGAAAQDYAPGEQIAEQSEDFRAFLILLDGKCRVMKTDAEGNFYFHKVFSAPAFMGEVPLLSGMGSQMTVTAETQLRGLRLDEDAFWKAMAQCPHIRHVILDEMRERMVGLQQQRVQQEKLAMLGTMTAGLMHELNNPGAAARRAASQLRSNLQHMHEIARTFSETRHTEAQRACLSALQERALSVRKDRCMSTLEQSDAEEEMGEWLSERGIAKPWDVASVMVASGINTGDLECLAGVFGTAELAAPVEWVEATASSMQMVSLVEESVARVTELAQSVKSYAHEGQGGEQDVNVNESIHATVVMMKHKLREKNIRISKEFGPDMPKIHCMCSGLNQVWTNLLDNAIDAAPAEGGMITIRTAREGDGVQITIGDNGPGISAEDQERIFDPFFTTKAAGKGTGLGLGIVRKLLEQYDGRLTLQSAPGRTEFTVHLPPEPATHR